MRPTSLLPGLDSFVLGCSKTGHFQLNGFCGFDALVSKEVTAAAGHRPAESSVCVLKEDAGVALSLQHPVPVERVICLKRTLKVLEESV